MLASPSGTTYAGPEQLRQYLQDLVAQHFHSEVVGSRTVVGTTETHRARVSYAQLQPLGIASLETRAEVIVQGGQIQSFVVTFTPESLAQLQAALCMAGSPLLPLSADAAQGSALGSAEKHPPNCAKVGALWASHGACHGVC
jgi:hypothetical protein